MIVKSRGIIQPYASVRMLDGELKIRVDCECNSEAWIDISLPVSEIALAEKHGRLEGEAGLGESRIILRSENETEEGSGQSPVTGDAVVSS